MMEAYKKVAIIVFGTLADRLLKRFESLKFHLVSSGIGILLRSWICIIFLSVVISYLISFAAVIILNIFFIFDFATFLYLLVFIPILVAAFVFLSFYLYPIQRAKNIKSSIETDLPFALAHISAIASSGIPPEFMFELLLGFEEYRGISDQARLIIRDIRTFGMSSISAMKDVAKKTPSPAFKQLLLGMSSIIERGGNLVEYLKEMSDKALADYRIRREKYLKTLSTYADIYTALLVAAPLMMLAILGIMSVIGGEIMGLAIQDVINITTWIVLPVLNISFLAFIHVTFPGL